MIEPKPFSKKVTDKIIGVVDTETDPFDLDEFGNPIFVKPFSIGFYDGAAYWDFWGDDCVDQYFRHLEANYAPNSLIIFAHNGGRFDFMLYLEWLNAGQKPFMIDAKIVAAYFGGQQHRDSYKLMPFPLAEYKKTEIDYAKFKRGIREKHKREILAYQRDDVMDLYALVSTFFDEYGDRLTIASTALPLLHSFHGFETLGEGQDTTFRQFFFGGRVDVFEGGIIRTCVKVYDVNSMYPHVMRDFIHPVGCRPTLSTSIGPSTFFICMVARNRGALCTKAEDGSLTFHEKQGVFFVTIHEYLAGMKVGLFDTIQIKHCWDFEEYTTFAAFVDKFYGLRLHYKAIGDLARALFVKYILNSAYGKFAQDPRKYEEFEINEGDIPTNKAGEPDHYNEETNPEGWGVHTVNGKVYIWSRPSRNKHRSFKNVATGASITGAARSVLLLAIARAKRPIYCDTDSIICEGLNADLDPSRLGAWKLEAEGDLIAVAGKKLYAVFSKTQPEKRVDKDDDGLVFDPVLGAVYCIKKASKGAKLTAAEIYRIAKGETVSYTNPVPAFQLDGSAKITKRRIKRTV